ncbi:lebercilin-like isoform X2 [Haliotis asinina]|uniref:lebercilin-like isoform X2 n=1 Tax=Haliotis asinina TaxID=109174 RepID=UPI00353271F4
MSKDDYDDYSDDFISDDEDFKSKSRNQGKQAVYGKNKANSKSRGRGRGRGGGPPQKQSPRLDYVTQRMLSAGRIKINELRNQVEDQNTVIRELREENKLLKKTQHRHEKALTKYEDQEGDLPKLILQHNNETRTLKDQLRTMKEKYEKTDRYLRDAEDDLDRANVKLKKYKSYAENKGLPERDELNRKLSKAELDLEEKDKKIKELQRHIEHLSKNHRHELGVEIARHRETKRQLDQYLGEKDNLETKLKEKEKELEIKNIYSNRVMRAPHKLPASYGGTPLDTPPPPRRRVPSVGEMSAREKARMFEMKRREEAKKNKPKPKPKQDVFENRWNKEAEERDRLAMEEKERRDLENKYLQAREEEERRRERQRELEMQREQERQFEQEQEDLRRERQRMKRESEELERREVNRQREQREREERERKEQEERDRRERDERDRIERENRLRQELKEREEEMERQAQAERERLDNDPRVLEERRKKELLLARLKAIDDGSKENVSPVNNSPYGDDSSTPISRKSYSFSKPTENLHNGKPAYEEVSVPYLDRRKQQRAQEEDAAGYNPSFARRSSGTSSKKLGINESPSRKPNKKSALMDELFGTQSGTNKKDDDLFQTIDSRKQTTKRSSGFPWDEESKHSATASRPRENSSTLFGGGAALVEDDGPSDKSKLLPRRQRHQTSTFSSKPAVSAVDTFEDDIEEVML